MAADAIALGDIELSIDVIDSSAAIWAALGTPNRLPPCSAQPRSNGSWRASRVPNPISSTSTASSTPPGGPSPGRPGSAPSHGGLLTIEDAVSEATSDRSIHTPA